MSYSREPFPTDKRGRRPKETFYISGELVNSEEASERLGMKEDTFAKKRRKIIPKLARGEALTWDHFK